MDSTVVVGKWAAYAGHVDGERTAIPCWRHREEMDTIFCSFHTIWIWRNGHNTWFIPHRLNQKKRRQYFVNFKQVGSEEKRHSAFFISHKLGLKKWTQYLVHLIISWMWKGGHNKYLVHLPNVRSEEMNTIPCSLRTSWVWNDIAYSSHNVGLKNRTQYIVRLTQNGSAWNGYVTLFTSHNWILVKKRTQYLVHITYLG